jgi:Tol biopolymer transport system component
VFPPLVDDTAAARRHDGRMTRRLPLALLLLLSLAAPASAAPHTSLESVGRAGARGDAASGAASGREVALSAGGRHLAFSSEADNLVAGDTNGTSDVFVRDRARRRTMRISVSSAGAEGDGASFSPAISAGGRYVAFASTAGNLAAGGQEGRADIYLHDRRSGRTTRVSNRMDGFDGPRVLSYAPALSAGARYVAFAVVRQVVYGDEVDHEPRGILVFDRRTGTTRRVSAHGETGRGGPAISADGRFVAFSARGAGEAVALGAQPEAHVAARRLARHGDESRRGPRRLARREDESRRGPRSRRGPYRVYVRDLRTGRTALASVGPDGAPLAGDATAPSLSRDGRIVAFQLSPQDGPIGDLHGPVGDVYVRDRARGATTLASPLPDGTPSGLSGFPALSADGRAVAFVSAAPLLEEDTTGWMDVYVRTLR